MKMNSVLVDSKLLKKDSSSIEKIQKKLNNKLLSYDFDFTRQLQRENYLIHDFFYINQYLFIIYKQDHYRVLLYCDIENRTFIIISFYYKSKNHIRYYDEFRRFAEKKMRGG